MSLRDPVSASIVALLGPTNTGKTHRAIERMLTHPSGMIGLPLRLLAREVYDRVVARVGADHVALVTGEEKRTGRSPRYFVCTVEAMPVERPVSFIAVDEIQLAEDPERGHVFTDRLLHARGGAETMLLGSEAMLPVLDRLVPTARLERQPRLSKLTFDGARALGDLPRRSAVIGFSADRVYALAEALKQRRGGVAVVMGALSPRARNAQVAMYQAGEVQWLVATDAIGMGLNLDVDHVAFADLGKFDGSERRGLRPGEIGQIAGRAGRYRRDGTFGTTDGLPPLPDDLAADLEAHRFPAVRTIRWRNADLDTSSCDALWASLNAPAPSSLLVRTANGEDQVVFDALRKRPEVRRLANGSRVRTLWDVCSIPDYRRAWPGAHADLLQSVFLVLVEHGAVPAPWLRDRLRRLDRVDGDIASLTQRIAQVRTWSFVAWRAGWVDDASAVRDETIDLEDRLSDALHARLTERFVERRSVTIGARAAAEVTATIDGGTVRVGDLPPFPLRGVTVGRAPGQLDPAHASAVARAVAPVLRERAQTLADDHDVEISVDDVGAVWWSDGPVAQLHPGPSAREPELRLHPGAGFLSEDSKAIVVDRLRRWRRDRAADLAGVEVVGSDPAVKAILWGLVSRLGILRAAEVADALEALDARGSMTLRGQGVHVGAGWVWAGAAMRPDRRRDASVWWAVYLGRTPVPAMPGAPWMADPGSWPSDLLEAIGYATWGPVALRADVWERATAAGRRRADVLTEAGVPSDRLPGVLARWSR